MVTASDRRRDHPQQKLARREAAVAVGAVLAVEGDLAGAEHEFAHAERFFRDELATVDHARLLVRLADIRCRRGRLDEAAAALGQARDAHAELGDSGTVPLLAGEVEAESRKARAVGYVLLVPWLVRRMTTPAMLLAVMLGCFGVVLGCGLVTGELLGPAERPGGSTSFDSSITSWVVAHRTRGLTTVARVLSTVGSQAVLLPVAAIVTVLLVGRRRFVPAGLLVAAWGGAIGLYSLTKDFVDRMRPPRDIWLTDVGRTSSFPSGHATQSLATFVVLAVVGAIWLPRARRPALVLSLVLAIGVGWSRVYLGVHWATDVGSGWLLAAAWITVVVWLARAAGDDDGPRVASRSSGRGAPS